MFYCGSTTLEVDGLVSEGYAAIRVFWAGCTETRLELFIDAWMVYTSSALGLCLS